MSTWIYRLAHLSYRHRKQVVAWWVVVLGVLGTLTATVGGTFDDEFRIPGASSQIALDQLNMTFPEAAMASAAMVVIAPPGAQVKDPAVREPLERIAGEIDAVAWVAAVQLPYDEYVDGLISDDGTAGMVNIRVDGYSVSTFTDDQRAELVAFGQEIQDAIPGSEVHVGGDLFSVTMPTVTIVEAIGVGVAIIVLVLVLGSLRAAVMPLISALLGAGASIMLIVIGAGVFPVNSTTMILALMLALAVGIDYSLFIVSRHRDQLATGMDPEESAARATATAGSAVVFAGLTVIIALVGLGVAGMPFLTIMGAFAAAAVAVEVVISLTLLPAMLGFAGSRLTPKPSKRERPRWNASRWWVSVCTRFPLITIAVVVAGLAAMTIPAQHLQLALPNSGRNEPTAMDRITFDVIAERFGVGYNGPLVVTGSIVESTDPMGVIDGIRSDIEALPGVKMVALAVPNANVDTALIQIIPDTGPDDPATTELVNRIRALEPTWQDEYGVSMSVTGFTAVAIDVSSQLGSALFPFGLFVVGLSLILLTIVFRSLIVPIKAALGYLLSVGAAFGATALIFNRGIGAQLVNLHEPQPVISFLPIILMGILFGLAMDYEVFLTSRMREEYVHGNHTNPTEEGFVHSAKVVVAAAIIMVSVFAFFIPEGEGMIKPIAFGLAFGVAVDAFLVRMTLGPAVMRLLGGRAWWLPSWLDRRLPVLDIEGEALTHQLSLADWPSPGATQAIHGEGLGATSGRTTLFSGIDIDLQPGRTLVVSGGPASRRALLLALTGRLRFTSGEVKVLGLVLPQQAAQLRRRATFVDGAGADAARILADPVGDLVVVDDADRLSADARRALVRLAEPPSSGDPVTLVLGAADAARVRDLLPQSPAPRAGENVLIGGAL